MIRRLLAPVVLAALLLSSAADANPTQIAPQIGRADVAEAGADGPVVRAVRLSVGQRDALRPHALSSTRAETDSFHGVALFAGRELFTSFGGAIVYGMEGGAAIRLLEKIDLTARYRVLSYETVDPLGQLDPEVHAPLFGFALKF